jgi:hypothetical protein
MLDVGCRELDFRPPATDHLRQHSKESAAGDVPIGSMLVAGGGWRIHFGGRMEWRYNGRVVII